MESFARKNNLASWCLKLQNFLFSQIEIIAVQTILNFWIFMELISRFMEERNTPIERPPMLGFKQSINLELQHVHRANLTFVSVDLHMFFQKVLDQGGYEGCVSKKAWKSVYDELGGNPQNTSAATCTRRHYEKWVVIGDTKHTYLAFTLSHFLISILQTMQFEKGLWQHDLQLLLRSCINCALIYVDKLSRVTTTMRWQSPSPLHRAFV